MIVSWIRQARKQTDAGMFRVGWLLVLLFLSLLPNQIWGGEGESQPELPPVLPLQTEGGGSGEIAQPVELVPSAPASAGKLQGALGPASLWDVYTGNLRAGRMRAAYRAFSKPSRKIFSYRDFLNHYHPLTATSQAILSPANQGELQLAGDLASFRYMATPDREGTETLSDAKNSPRIMVTALMVREGGRWFLVAAQRERAARAEAEARNILRQIGRTPRYLSARAAKKNLALDGLRAIVPEAFRTSDATMCLHYYSFELEAGALGMELVARPRRQEDKLRTFRLTVGGRAVSLPQKMTSVNLAAPPQSSLPEKLSGELNDTSSSPSLPMQPAAPPLWGADETTSTRPNKPQKKESLSLSHELPSSKNVEPKKNSAPVTDDLPPPPPDLGDPDAR